MSSTPSHTYHILLMGSVPLHLLSLLPPSTRGLCFPQRPSRPWGGTAPSSGVARPAAHSAGPSQPSTPSTLAQSHLPPLGRTQHPYRSPVYTPLTVQAEAPVVPHTARQAAATKPQHPRVALGRHSTSACPWGASRSPLSMHNGAGRGAQPGSPAPPGTPPPQAPPHLHVALGRHSTPAFPWGAGTSPLTVH